MLYILKCLAYHGILEEALGWAFGLIRSISNIAQVLEPLRPSSAPVKFARFTPVI